MFSVKEFVNCMKHRFRLTWKTFRKNVEASRKLGVGYGLFGENPCLMWKAFARKVKALRKWAVDNVFRRHIFESDQPKSSQDPWWSRFKISFKSHRVVEILILLNVGVFLLWGVADLEFMKQNFLVGVGNVRSGRLHTMITSSFSHYEFDHIVGNMFLLYLYGKKVVYKFGPKFLLKLYMAWAIAGSGFFLLERAFIEDICGHSELALLGICIVRDDVILVLTRNKKVVGSCHLGGVAVAAIV